jgi:hypothetical protein
MVFCKLNPAHESMEQQLITTEYPRIYRTPGRWFFVNVLFSLVLSMPGLGLCWLDIHFGDDGSIVLLGLGCALSLLGALPIISALRAKVVLDADRIETQGLFSRRSIVLSEIQGRRAVKDGNGWRTGSTWLIPRGAEDADNKITISNELRGNSALRQWIDSLPDLDAPATRLLRRDSRRSE